MAEINLLSSILQEQRLGDGLGDALADHLQAVPNRPAGVRIGERPRPPEGGGHSPFEGQDEFPVMARGDEPRPGERRRRSAHCHRAILEAGAEHHLRRLGRNVRRQCALLHQSSIGH